MGALYLTLPVMASHFVEVLQTLIEQLSQVLGLLAGPAQAG
jgi:hypothetical protein